MLIALLVILGVLGLILLSVVALTPEVQPSPVGDKMNFGDFLDGGLNGQGFNGTWISGKRASYFLRPSSFLFF